MIENEVDDELQRMKKEEGVSVIQQKIKKSTIDFTIIKEVKYFGMIKIYEKGKQKKDKTSCVI